MAPREKDSDDGRVSQEFLLLALNINLTSFFFSITVNVSSLQPSIFIFVATTAASFCGEFSKVPNILMLKKVRTNFKEIKQRNINDKTYAPLSCNSKFNIKLKILRKKRPIRIRINHPTTDPLHHNYINFQFYFIRE